MGAANSAEAVKAMKAIEYRIARNLMEQGAPERALNHEQKQPQHVPLWRWGDRLIAVLAVVAGLIVVGSFLEELIWVVLAAGTMVVLGHDT